MASKTNKNKEKAKDTKKTKKKKTRKLRSAADSDDSSSSSSDSSDSDDSFEKKRSNTKKRKKAKEDSSSPEEISNSEKETPDTPSSKGRKNIRKLLGDQDVGKETKMASVAEKERRERVKTRQKLYNEITEDAGDFGEAITRKLVLETDPKTKEELVEVPPEIISKLKPHQVQGVKFMWECVVESLSRLEKEGDTGSGCVLAHCMGLGKTLQVIAFISTLLNNKRVSGKIKTALVACPVNTIRNWSREFEMWTEGTEAEVEVFEIVDVKDNHTRADVLQHWHKKGGVMIMSYAQFRNLAAPKKVPKRCKAIFESTLLDPGPDLVICDEGHVLKNESSALSKTMTKMATRRRVVLTGTPLQNNLIEYHCMIQFVKPLLLGTKKEFQNRFINPICNGQCADSNQGDVKLMKKRVHILHKLLEGCVQRCDYSHVTKYLLPKYEFVISVRLSEAQISLYRLYLSQFSSHKKKSEGGEDGGDDDNHDKTRVGTGLFKDYNILRLIWTHPYLLQMQKKRADRRALFQDDDSMSSFINDDSEEDSDRVPSKANDADEVVCLSDTPVPGPSQKKSKKKKEEDDSDVEEVVSNWTTKSRGNRSDKSESEEEEIIVDNEWWNEFVAQDQLTRIELSGKMYLLFEILKQCELVGDKVLLFTQSLLALDLIEELLQKMDEENRAKPETEMTDQIGTWVNGIDYFRMDGSTSADVRKKCINIFNNPENERARLFMISTKAGSLGTNMVGANRVVVLDASWNPTHDVQAIFRVYRFGQKKPVYVYRLLAQGSMEEKIYDRQVTKQSMAFRVVDEHQIERHFNAADLEELYSFEPDSKSNRPTPMVPKDRLLAELLINENTKDWIVTYHEHDSLLENIAAEELTEDERKVAWAEYEAEREGLLDQQAQMNVESSFLLEIMEKDSTGELSVVLTTIRELRPETTKDQMIRYILEMDKICNAKTNELVVISSNLKKNNEAVPQEMQTKLIHFSKLFNQTRSFKQQHMAQLMQQRRAQEAAYNQRVQQAQEEQRQRSQQEMLRQQFLLRQAQQAGQQPQFAHGGAKVFVQRQGNMPGHRFQAPPQHSRPVNGTAENISARFGQNYSRNVESVVRVPVITEVVDDEPTPESNAGKSSGPIITEID